MGWFGLAVCVSSCVWVDVGVGVAYTLTHGSDDGTLKDFVCCMYSPYVHLRCIAFSLSHTHPFALSRFAFSYTVDVVECST